MKVSKRWLQELVDLKVSIKEVEKLLPLRTIGTKEVTEDSIELDMKGYNRADLLSMRGVAREVAAITNSEVKFQVPAEIPSNLPPTKVEVQDKKLCPVYCIAKIEGLKSEPSKPEWVGRLADCGMRSVNNIADITNLIMLEYGQPMHSFDADQVASETLIVRTAEKGEKIKTLDEKTRELDESDLLIADPEKPLGLAGVMGGKDSEASDSTTTIFLEAAIFDPISIRKTMQRHNLYSEASKRFQHGLTKTNLLQALSAAIKLYEELGGKLTAITLVGDLEDKPKTVELTQEKVNSLIGIDIKPEEVESYLEMLGFSLATQGSAWEATIPYWRLDIDIEEDLIEEVARMYGYEKIPAKKLEGDLPKQIDQSQFKLIYGLKSALADSGLTEVQTYSFFSTKVLGALGFNPENAKNAVKVANPISSETEYMRTFIWPNLIEVVEKNMKQGFSDIAVFEIGKVYQPARNASHSDADGPRESYRLAIALMNGSDNPIEELLVIFRSVIPDLIGNPEKKQSPWIPDQVRDDKDDIKIEKGDLMKELEALFHPKRFANITSGGKPLGGIAEVHPRFLNQIGIDKRVAILEIAII